MLSLAISNPHFPFNTGLSKQIEGLSLGNPAAPALANVFMCNLEEKLLDECPQNFKPICYKRYLDDTFVVFKEPDHASLFHNYINAAHPNITFTM